MKIFSPQLELAVIRFIEKGGSFSDDVCGSLLDECDKELKEKIEKVIFEYGKEYAEVALMSKDSYEIICFLSNK